MPNMFLAILGVALLATSVALVFTPFGSQAQLIGTNNVLQVKSISVIGATTKPTILALSITNTQSQAIEYFHLVTVSGSEDIAQLKTISGQSLVPMKLVPAIIGASETKTFNIDISCVSKCNSDGTFTTGEYMVSVAFWKRDISSSSICADQPFAFECFYTQISPATTTGFTIFPQLTANIVVLGCYGFTVGGLNSCTDSVPASAGSVEPSGTLSYPQGTSVTFTAKPIEGKSKFLHWLVGYQGRSDLQMTKNTVNPLVSKVDNNQIYVAIFEKPFQLTVLVQSAYAGTTDPKEGTYEKLIGEKVTITMKPKAEIVTGPNARTVYTVLGYEVTSGFSPIKEKVMFPNDSPLVLGTASTKTVDITMDISKVVLVMFVENHVLDEKKPPMCLIGCGTGVGGLPILPLGVGVAGVVALLGSVLVGRKGVV